MKESFYLKEKGLLFLNKETNYVIMTKKEEQLLMQALAIGSNTGKYD